ncbi:TrkA family potassium uptake protein [Gramella jeungdoensis]|uniref:TrkA family potassium uptake protein n=1 Tax=Gramella jeungdoensis TaxID=708091 RepID=A0ABT0YZR0_9FLAO|nr:TrkA family potassium uptake protein [Gramella jeungdoensis]MCM8568019.1 TrkA family potassium uptake protein [Gramella jeungdoensis]
MKYIIIGLGKFGSALGEKLTEMGNEVIGVDIRMNKIENIKEKITHAINLDATDPEAVGNLPLKDADVVIIAIGENTGSNIMAGALMQKMQVKRIIGRVVDPLQKTVLEAMGINEIIHPEEETAERWAKRLNLEGVVDSFELDGSYSIVETRIPKEYHDKSIKELEIKDQFNIIVLTTMKVKNEKNEMGVDTDKSTVQGIARADTKLYKDEIMVLYGHNKDIKKLLDEHRKFKEGM